MLQISLRTLRHRMSEYGITQKMFQSTITELQLDDKVRQIVRYFPQIGYRRLLDEHKSKILGLPITRPENLYNELTRLE